jgi:predicted transcriptional regulator
MKKNSPLAFRIPADLKKKLQQVADKETRSISQICEMLLSIGIRAYEREGSGYLHRYRGHEGDAK